jgi:hypothetical protein
MGTLLVATRKGLLRLDAESGRPLGPPAFLGEPVSAVLDDPRDGRIYAALRLGHFGVKLHVSEDGGVGWREVVAPAFPKAADAAAAPAVDMVWALEAGGPAEPGRIWAGTLPAALFRSEDRGESWRLVDSLWDRPERKDWMGGGYDHPGLHSILVDPRDPRRLTVAISTGGVWRSADGGATWALGGRGLRQDHVPPERTFDPGFQDPHRLAACAAAPDVVWCQHHNGIFRSTDAAASFTEIEGVRPAVFGFAVAAHPADPDTAWFVPAIRDERRVPVDGRLVVTRTRDGGRSFEALGRGLPEHDCFDLVYRHALDVDATGEHLAMGSTTGHLWLGEEGGARWRRIAGNLPPIAQVRFLRGTRGAGTA